MNIVDTLGRIQVASPASEWVHLWLGKNADQTLPSGTTTACNWTHVVQARGLVVSDWWSAGSNPDRIYVPTGWAGLYNVSVMVQHTSQSAGTNRTVDIRLNGDTVAKAGSTHDPRSAALPVKQTASINMLLNAGDYIDIGVFQNSGVSDYILQVSSFTISRLPLGVPMGTSSAELVYVEADKDGDGDKDPLTSADWNGGTKNGTGTINWNTDFGVPADAKAVVAQVTVKDVTSQQFLGFQAKSTTTNYSCWVYTTANMYVDSCMTIPIAANGTSYWAATSNLDNVYVRVIGWYVERPRQT